MSSLFESLASTRPQKLAPFTEEESWCQLHQWWPGKAMEPDGNPARVLKTCTLELSPIITLTLLQILSDCHNTHPLENYHRCHPTTGSPPILPISLRGAQWNAVACLLHLLLPHLDSSGSFARILFVVFSSALTPSKGIWWSRSSTLPPRLNYLIHNFLSRTDCKQWEWVQPQRLHSPPTPEHHRVVCLVHSCTHSTQKPAPHLYPSLLTSSTKATFPCLIVLSNKAHMCRGAASNRDTTIAVYRHTDS